MYTKGSLTRQKIIEKSMQFFSVKGYFNTSIDDICKAAGLTKGGLYGHFHSKEEIWYAGYDECVRIWKGIVFKGVRGLADPLARLDRVIENSLKNYLGADVFEGGCFLLNSLVELAGQQPAMSGHVLKGFWKFADLLHQWLAEAAGQGLLKEGLNLREVALFLVITMNGASSMYAASKDPLVWQQTLAQLKAYLGQLRKAEIHHS
jgi:TetR/AcrR family transcriptional regulator, transcriptional repressor for nem operon